MAEIYQMNEVTVVKKKTHMHSTVHALHSKNISQTVNSSLHVRVFKLTCGAGDELNFQGHFVLSLLPDTPTKNSLTLLHAVEVKQATRTYVSRMRHRMYDCI